MLIKVCGSSDWFNFYNNFSTQEVTLSIFDLCQRKNDIFETQEKWQKLGRCIHVVCTRGSLRKSKRILSSYFRQTKRRPRSTKTYGYDVCLLLVRMFRQQEGSSLRPRGGTKEVREVKCIRERVGREFRIKERIRGRRAEFAVRL